MPGAGAPLEASLVVAACAGLGIGKGGALPWPRLPGDLARFKRLTLGHAVVMGSATYASLPASVRPLPGRTNVVLSSRGRAELGLPDEVLLAGGLDAAEALLRAAGAQPGKVFVIGGESVFRAALARPEWSARVLLTEVLADFPADRFFPADLRDPAHGFRLVSQGADAPDGGVPTRLLEFARPAVFLEPPRPAPAPPQPHPERQYLDLVARILAHGDPRGDRTGTGTRALFGAQMRFDLRESFPLLTTKRVFWRGVVEELLWFIRGSTDAKELSARGVRIWDANGSRAFLDARGFRDREEGDLGPVYGFQWRHFGAQYRGTGADYAGEGVDQLQDVIRTIRERPTDRRMLICAWNPAAVADMALPPCHLLAQFFVARDELSCMMYQRSADMGLGVPFNIASYALLTCLVASVCGLRPGEFVHVLGDAHVYDNHAAALRTQLRREPRPFPTLEVHARDDIEGFTADDIVLHGYDPHKSIAMEMAV